MKRLLVVLALVLGLLLPAAKAQLPTFQLSQELLDFMATAPAADDLVAGEGKFAPTEKGESMQFTVSAHGPGGPTLELPLAAAKGNLRLKINGVEEHGRVECMHVEENEAILEGSFDESVMFEGQAFPDFIMFVDDRGEPNGDLPDQANIGLDSNAAQCFTTSVILAGGAVQQGNIVVMDRP
jgi:hypothetical protein